MLRLPELRQNCTGSAALPTRYGFAVFCGIALGCGGSEPSGSPFAVENMVGVYDVHLTVTPNSGTFGPSCTPIVLARDDLTRPFVWSGSCLNNLSSAGTVAVAGDTLVLAVNGPGARPLLLFAFTGTMQDAAGRFSGAKCWPTSIEFTCIREFGPATLTRR